MRSAKRCRKICVGKILSLIFMFLIASALCYAQPVIKKIEFQGLKHISEDDVRSIFSLKEGDTYSPVAVNNLIKELYRTGKFMMIQEKKEPYEDGIKLILVFEEVPLAVEDIVIFGNHIFTADEIKRALPIKVGDTLPANAETLVWSKISQLYAEKKFYQISVDVDIAPGKESDSVVLSIYINEGKRLLIKDLIFKGNRSFSATRLRFLVTNRGSWWFLKRYYNPDAFEEDLNAIRQFYLARGFLDVVVKPGKFIYNEQKNWVCPVIEIQEGIRYKVSAIEPRGMRIFRKDEILKIFDRMVGHYFSARKLHKCLVKLQEMYGDEGFILMEPRYEFERDVQKGTVTLVLDIDEKQRVYVGEIPIERIEEYEIPKPEELTWVERWYLRVAPPVKEDVIRKEIQLKRGDVYRLYKERRTVERLKALGIFDEVKVRREPTEKPDVMNMVVSVKEGVTQKLIFTVGYGDASGAFFQTQYRERNLFGEAKDLKLNVLLGTKMMTFSIGYLDRYFRDTRTSLGVELYRDMLFLRGYDEIRSGGQVSFGIPGNEHLRHYIRLRAEYVDFKDVDDDIEEKIDSYPVATIRYRIVHDTRNDLKWPTSGDLKSAGIELGYADGALVKFTGGYDGYWRLYKDLVYALNTEVGVMPYDADRIGISERFFMGGSEDLRGFKYRGAGPHDPGEDDVPTGGSIKLLARNELRFPIYEKLRGLVFVDAGTIDDDFPGLGKPRLSAGFGFRFDVKIFYIALDFAHAFVKEDDDQTRFVHFRIGSLF